jgi:hypothetical protein
MTALAGHSNSYHPFSAEVEFDGSWPALEEVTAAMRASRDALLRYGLS